MGRSVTWTATTVPSARRRRILVVPRSVINASKVDTKIRSKKHRARTVCQDDSTTSLAAVLTVSCALRVSIVQVVQAVRAVRWMPPNACLAHQVVIKARLDKLRVSRAPQVNFRTCPVRPRVICVKKLRTLVAKQETGRALVVR